jgi:hypothetical protein
MLLGISIIVIIFWVIPNFQIIITGGANLQQILASISPVFAIIVGSVTLFNSVPQWYKLKDIPVLVYDGLEKYDYFVKYPQFDQPLGVYYYLKIKKSKRKRHC